MVRFVAGDTLPPGPNRQAGAESTATKLGLLDHAGTAIDADQVGRVGWAGSGPGRGAGRVGRAGAGRGAAPSVNRGVLNLSKFILNS